MSDNFPDRSSLDRLAYSQQGYFTARQAGERGFSPQLLAHHARTGPFERVRHGLYRLRYYPASPYDQVWMSWLMVGAERSVISHESALDLLGLSDVLPNAVHLLVERRERGVHVPEGAVLHTTATPLNPAEVVTRQGIRVTSPARTIIDTAASRLAPEHLAAAAREALERALVTRRSLLSRAEQRGRQTDKRVREAIEMGETK